MNSTCWTLFLHVLIAMVLCLAASSPADPGDTNNPSAAGAAGQAKLERIALKEGDGTVALTIVPGATAPAKITVEFADGKDRVLALTVSSQKLKFQSAKLPEFYTQAIKDPDAKESNDAPKVAKDAKNAVVEVELPDSYVSVSGTRINIFARPNLVRYTEQQQEERVKKWDSLTPASKKPIAFEFRRDPAGAVMWINGCYAGIIENQSELRGVSVSVAADGSIDAAGSGKLSGVAPQYLPLDISKIAKPGAMESASVSVSRGLQVVEGVPLIVADGNGNGDVGVVKEMKGSYMLELDEHLSRIALDGMPETLHFSVPKASYSKAHVLCAAEPDPKKDPVLTTRLTRFANSGRGDAIAHTSISLPRGDEKPGENLKVVGTIQYDTADGKVQVPLYLAEIPLQFGEILDLISMDKDPHCTFLDGKFLDFEFLGKLVAKKVKPDRASTSAVHVFGVTLEKSPFDISFVQSQPGNIFHNDEVPQTTAVLKSNQACELTLSWTVRDVHGQTIKTDRVPVRFVAAGEERRINVPLAMPKVGWYGLDFELSGDEGTVMVHRAAFALLGRDQRKAGYESPYGTWWFGHAHYGCDDVNIVGPLLFKAGFRRTTFGWTKSGEAEFAPWKVTLNQISWRTVNVDDIPGSEKKVAELLKRFPHCNVADVFHESYRSYLPEELFDRKPQESAEEIEKAKQRVELGTKVAQFYRERFPQIKLIWGNSGATTSIVAMLLRNGLDPKYVDYFGLETSTGQTAMPEKLSELTPQAAYLIKEAARKFGVEKPITGCFEFTARRAQDLGADKQALFYVRDILVSHAHDFRHISPGLLYDAGNAYYHTIWGGSGISTRPPFFYPKPAYVAMATLTNALDQVTLRRKLSTGSASVHALEFDRADGRIAYALWTPRAEADLKLEFPDDAQLVLFETYGEISEPKLSAGSLSLVVGPSPRYLISTRPANAAAVVKQITEKVPDGFQVADRMDDASAWSLVSDDTTLTRTSGELPRHVPGKFTVRQANDPERGPCVELELHGDSSLPDLVGEYGVISLAKPAAVPGEPHTLGIWVKGNSSWGKIVFEFSDAEGKVWRTNAREWHDWPGELSINFDGWHFIQFPIDERSPVPYASPGGRVQCDKGGNQRVAYPIHMTRLYVVMNRKAMDLNEMKPVSPIIRLSDVGAF